MPMQPQVTFEPFEKWGMDFVGPINPPSKQRQYIIVCTDYLTKWAEKKAIKVVTREKVAEFLRENIFYKFGTSTPYHPQANGQVEVINRALEGILTKGVSSSRKYYVNRLVEATWAYNTTWKTTRGFTPYELVYGKKALLSIEFEYNTLRMAAQLDLDLSHAQKERLLQLKGLDEQRLQALLHTKVVQLQRKIWHEKNIKEKQFQEGYSTLLYDSRQEVSHHGLIKLLVEEGLHTFTISIAWEIFRNMTGEDDIKALTYDHSPSESGGEEQQGEEGEEIEEQTKKEETKLEDEETKTEQEETKPTEI
eukprot:PITA_29333